MGQNQDSSILRIQKNEKGLAEKGFPHNSFSASKLQINLNPVNETKVSFTLQVLSTSSGVRAPL